MSTVQNVRNPILSGLNFFLDPANPKFRRRWFEFDLGWAWLQMFVFLKLAKLKQT